MKQTFLHQYELILGEERDRPARSVMLSGDSAACAISWAERAGVQGCFEIRQDGQRLVTAHVSADRLWTLCR